MKYILFLFCLFFFGRDAQSKNMESMALPTETDSAVANLFTAEYIEQVTNRAQTIHEKGLVQIEKINARIISIEDKLKAATDRVDTALELGDISDQEAERRRNQIKRAYEALNILKPLIENEQEKLNQLFNLLNG
jgi:hypothetical protein